MEVQSNVNSPSTVAFVLPSWAPIFGSSVLPLQVVGKGFRLLMPHKLIKGNTSQLSRKIKRPSLICWMINSFMHLKKSHPNGFIFDGKYSLQLRKVWRHDSTGRGSMYPAAVSTHQAAPQRLDCPMLLEELSSLLAQWSKQWFVAHMRTESIWHLASWHLSDLTSI